MITLKGSRFFKYALFLMVFSIIATTLSILSVKAQTRTPSTSTSSPTPTLIVPSGKQGGVNLTVSPISINLAANPGEEVSSQIKIRNNDTEKVYLKMSVLKFTSSQGGAPVIADITPSDEFGRWVSFDEPEFTLDAGQEKTERFKIEVPKDAALGYYYALKIEQIQGPEEQSKKVTIQGAPAIPVLLEVRSPHAKRELQITDFTTDSAFYEYLPVEFKVTVKNNGNIHSIPVGDIFIDSSLFGIGEGQKNVGSMVFNAGRGNVLPQTKRDYFTTWDDALMVRVPKATSGKESSEYTIKWDLQKGNKLRMGKYTAHLLMVYDNGQRDIPLEAAVSFWVLPWKYMIGALIILLLAFVGLKDTFSKLFKKVRRTFGSG